MTMPTLITNVQNKIFYTRFMKARNMIENALQMYENDYGNIKEGATLQDDAEAVKIYATYFKGAKLIDESNWEEECAGYDKKNVAANYDGTDREIEPYDMCHSGIPYGLRTMDGMLIMPFEDLGYGGGGFVDTNGPENGPNTIGRDIFVLYMEEIIGCKTMWGYSKECAEEEEPSLTCTENSKSGDDCGQRLILEGKMA